MDVAFEVERYVVKWQKNKFARKAAPWVGPWHRPASIYS